MFKISFDFDETTKKISNIKVVSDTPKEVDLTNPTLLVLDNKLKLSDSAIALLNATANDRIAINYWPVNNEETFPVIGRAEVFTDRDGGNRLTQTNTVSFRGRQRDTLLIYGDQFTLEEFKNEVENGLFIDDDGYGYYATETTKSDIYVYPSDFTENIYRDDFTHIIWFNR